MLKKLKLFSKVTKKDGLKAALAKSTSYAVSQAVGVEPKKIDTIGFYQNILSHERGFGIKLTKENLPKGSMTWIIPDFSKNSGGHINLVRMCSMLKDLSFTNQRMVIIEPHRWSSCEEAQAAFDDAFGENGIQVTLGADSIEPCEYLFATGWQTAYIVAKYKDAIHKLYFVQDFEPFFYAKGSESYLAENTYKLGLTAVTAGTWLSEILRRDFGMKTMSYNFACDIELYQQMPKRPRSKKNIFFYARPVTQRRCFELGLMAINKVCKGRDDIDVIFAGWDVSQYEIPFNHLNAGEVSTSELPDLYSQCDVALVLSATNLSLLPLEIAACGCPVIINDSPQASWLFNEDEAFYCSLEVDDLAETIEKVLNNEKLANTKASKAKAKALKSDWKKEALRVEKFLKSLDENK